MDIATTIENVLRVIAETGHTIEDAKQTMAEAGRELTRLRARNAELLAALKEIQQFADHRWGTHHTFRDLSDMAEKAIAKAESQ